MARATYLGKDRGGLRTTDLPAPAKINLFLAITGRRPDGYHDLLSVAAPLVWGDSLSVEIGGDVFSVTCDDPAVPTDVSNLVIKAAEAFVRATGWQGGARFAIAKRIPAGAGLGGGSSDAVTALMALNAAAGGPLDAAGLTQAASSIGSDCALFLSRSPVVMRGRGERVEPLPAEAYSRIRGMRILIFRPAFAISTPWAYGRLAAESPRGYLSPSRAEARLATWLSASGSPAEELMFNSMERPAFAKFPALPALLELLRYRFGIAARMSGSGSACFALLHENQDARPLESAIREAWGASALVIDTRIA